MPDSISSHGCIFSIETTPGGGYVEVGEVGDITDPGSLRNEFDVTTHGLDIDNYILGVHRRDPLTITVFYNHGGTSNHSALQDALDANTFMGFSMTQPDGNDWVASGFVRQITKNLPVDGPLSANVTIRMSGEFYRNGVLVGS